MIAEEIIAGYFRIRDFLKEARNSFLKNKSKVYKEKAKQHAFNFGSRVNTSATLELNRQNLKLNKAYVKNVQQAQVIAENMPEKLPEDYFNSDPQFNTFLKKLRRDQMRGKEPRVTGINEVRIKKKVNSTMFGNLSLKTYRHILHPTSKLLIGSASDKTYHHRETMKVDQKLSDSKIVEEYRLTTRRHAAIIDPGKFKKALSMGPKSNIPETVELG